MPIDSDLAALLDLGVSVVRVARGDKVPLGKAWPTLATTDRSQIESWLAGGYNIGLLCGTAGIIDVEFDSDDGRETLKRLGILDVPTPTWSSSRGEHRLFRIDGLLPEAACRKFGGAELRFGGRPAQSVLPPSRHPAGVPYRWTVSPADVPPATFERRWLP